MSKTSTAIIGAGLSGELSAGTSAMIARWTPFIKEASKRFGIAEDWITAVMRMESGGHAKSANGMPITSKTGAMGLMQLMPQTWRDMQRTYGLGQNPYDPHDNVIAGAAYLRWLYGKFGFPKMFAAYNAGPATETEHSAGLRELPDETRNYVRGIAHILGSKEPVSEAVASAGSSAMRAIAAAKPMPESAMVSFTRPDGVQIDIDAATVTSIRVPIIDEYAPGVRTVLSMGLRRQGVLEAPENVAATLRGHGARI
ncbi:MAG: lytic transglycosylase domain-containing protein [Alphaproteobacteria bacterium]|nr:lytic transglycosylase domain-containing protein [Alphaproteobacteria bacterium]